MAPRVRVESVDALLRFRAALCKIAEAMRVGLDEAEAEIQRVAFWIKHEQDKYWKREIEKRGELFVRAKSALNRKKLDKTALGSKFSYVEEEKAMLAAQRRLDEAKQKAAAVQRWSRVLDEEIFSYKAAVQGLDLAVDVDVPRATAQLDNMIAALEAYASSGTPGEQRSTAALTGVPVGGANGAASMRREIPTPEELERDLCPRLRARTPPQTIRDATPVAPLPWQGAAYDADEEQAIVTALEARSALDKLALPKFPPVEDDKFVSARGAWGHPRVYLQRLESEINGDSGWFLGFADDTETDPAECEATRVCELLDRRGELEDWLDLPRGWLVVLAGAAPIAVFNEKDELVWSTGAGR